MTAMRRFVICLIALAATLAAGAWAAPPADDGYAFLRPVTWGTGPYLSDAVPSPKPAFAAPNAGLFAAEDDGADDGARVADACPRYGPGVVPALPGSEWRERVKPYLIPFETGPPAA